MLAKISCQVMADDVSPIFSLTTDQALVSLIRICYQIPINISYLEKLGILDKSLASSPMTDTETEEINKIKERLDSEEKVEIVGFS